MTDDELINNMAENLEKVLNATLEGNGLHAVQNMAIKDKFYRLISLARIGASVMPRPDNLSVAMGDIETERLRQITNEGWSAKHDDRHDFGELAKAAACYAMPPSTRNLIISPYSMETILNRVWPFGKEWWKPTDRRRDLIKAAALMVAEIERLDRLLTPAEVTTC